MLYIQHLFNNKSFYFQVIKNKFFLFGINWLISRIFKKLIYFIFWIFLLPITIIFHLIGFRRVMIFTERVGHLAAETNCFLQQFYLKEVPQQYYFIAAFDKNISNLSLLELWSLHIPIVRNQLLVRFIDIMTCFYFVRHEVFDIISPNNTDSKLHSVWNKWGNNPPLLSLNDKQKKSCINKLRSIGLPEDAWFVLFHCRESGYSIVDDNQMDFRNSKPETYVKGIKLITEAGGWVIRIGSFTAKPLSLNINNFIDLTTTVDSSGLMDVFLCSEAKFLLGSNSGLYLLASIFGTNVALANVIPYEIAPPLPGDLYIPKLLFNSSNSKLLNFNDCFESNLCNFQSTFLFNKLNIALLDNDEDDIQLLTKEMINLHLFNYIYTFDELSLKLSYKKNFRRSHFSFKSNSTVAFSFLLRYKYLL